MPMAESIFTKRFIVAVVFSAQFMLLLLCTNIIRSIEIGEIQEENE